MPGAGEAGEGAKVGEAGAAGDRVVLPDGRLLPAGPGDAPGTSLPRWTERGNAEQAVTAPAVRFSADGVHWAFTEWSGTGLRTTVGAESGAESGAECGAAFTAVVPGVTAPPAHVCSHAGCGHRLAPRRTGVRRTGGRFGAAGRPGSHGGLTMAFEAATRRPERW
ncbi:hypothetical protein AB0F92_31185 [Kitasatospora aureofaciens]|uniref:hypothetical protein n=1 Tax=Kitasatospora aureofaciens TaxID=1894 RepID=UPI0033D4BDA1